MKKRNKVILTILFLTFTITFFSSCFVVNANNISSRGFVRGANTDRVIETKDLSIEKTKKIILMDNFITMNYDRQIITNSKVNTIYKDDELNEYVFQENVLTGFIKNIDYPELSNEEVNQASFKSKIASYKIKIPNYRTLADVTAQSLLPVGTDLNDYTLISENFVESYQEYSYNYVKMIGNYRTNDSVTVNIDVNGQVTSFLTTDIGEFDSIEANTINDEMVENFVNNQMISLHGNNVEYTIESKEIGKYNSQNVINVYVYYVAEDGLFSSEVITMYL